MVNQLAWYPIAMMHSKLVLNRCCGLILLFALIAAIPVSVLALMEGQAQTKLPQWSYPLINSLPFVNDPTDQRAVSLSFGQNIYTPEDTQVFGAITLSFLF